MGKITARERICMNNDTPERDEIYISNIKSFTYALMPIESRYNSSILRDFLTTWSIRSRASRVRQMLCALTLVNQVLYSNALIIGTKSLKNYIGVRNLTTTEAGPRVL